MKTHREKYSQSKPLSESDTAKRKGSVPVLNDNRTQAEYAVQLQQMANAKMTKTDSTGLPSALKSGIEQLSGQSLNDVKVHYNSPEPAQLQAHAFAKGNQIHLASGQEKHLPHEAWHVVQQKQGRVKPTAQLKNIAVNDSPHLEQEADQMGQQALSMGEKGALLPVQRKQSAVNPLVFQLKRDHAEKYIKNNFKILREGEEDSSEELEDESSKSEDSEEELGKRDSDKVKKPVWIGKISFESVNAYIHNKKNPMEQRLALFREWNRAYKKGKWVIKMPDDFIETGGETISGRKRLKRSDSMELDSINYDNELQNQMAKKFIMLDTLEEGDSKKVPLFESTTEVTKLTRLYGKAFKKFGKKIKGAQFALKLGKHLGLFDAPKGNDLVYIPLKEDKMEVLETEDKKQKTKSRKKQKKEEPKTGKIDKSSIEKSNEEEVAKQKIAYLRNGKIFNWSDHADELERNIKDKENFKTELIKALEGEFIPASEYVVSTLGAMICDAKVSIMGFLHFLEELKSSKEIAPKKMFSSKKDDNPIWKPSIVEGRSLPENEKEKYMGSIKKEMRAFRKLRYNNCLIDAMAKAAGRDPATETELISIRIDVGSVGDMLLATPENVEHIRRILGINNTIIVRYNGRAAEVIDGGGSPLTIYHDGINHFTNKKPKDGNYDMDIKHLEDN